MIMLTLAALSCVIFHKHISLFSCSAEGGNISSCLKSCTSMFAKQKILKSIRKKQLHYQPILYVLANMSSLKVTVTGLTLKLVECH